MNMELKDFIKGTTVVEGNRVWHLETFLFSRTDT